MTKQKYAIESQEYALKKAKEYGYVNDEEYCESFINQHKSLSGWGEQKIISALFTKGVSKEIINKKMEELYSADEVFNNAYKCAIKKYEILKNKEQDKYKLKQKLYMFLGGRGYNYEVIQNVLEKILKE